MQLFCTFFGQKGNFNTQIVLFLRLHGGLLFPRILGSSPGTVKETTESLHEGYEVCW